MSLDNLTKAPADVLDYDFDFGRWLPSDDRLQDAQATLSGTTATVSRIDTDEGKARIWLSGGVNGESGTLTVTITTAEGRTKQVSAAIRIKETS